jgi:lipoprotein NlpI
MKMKSRKLSLISFLLLVCLRWSVAQQRSMSAKVETLNLEGIAFLQSSNYGLAFDKFNEALQLDPSRPGLW